MKEIKWASEVIKGNIDEAKRYIELAYEMRDTDKQTADWCRDMAQAHITFNTTGHNIVKRMIDGVNREDNPLAPGMLAVYEDIHKDVMRRTAEINAMISTY